MGRGLRGMSAGVCASAILVVWGALLSSGAAAQSRAVPTVYELTNVSIPAFSGVNMLEGAAPRPAAVTADGRTVVLGSAALGEHGGALTYVRGANGWTQLGTMLAPPETSGAARPAFGYSVAISGDGNTALVGDPSYGYDGKSFANQGAWGIVWAYSRTPSGWALAGKFKPSDQTGGELGTDLKLSADGRTALVTAQFATGGEDGAAWVFRRGANGAWVQATPQLLFGWSAALSSDGSTALICAWKACRVEDTAAGAWNQVGAWSLPDQSRSIWSTFVALSEDGTVAAIQDNRADGSDQRTLIYAKSSTGWPSEPQVIPGGGDPALSADGSRLYAGRAIYDRSPSGWTEALSISLTNAPNDHFLGSCAFLTPSGEKDFCVGWKNPGWNGGLWEISLANSAKPTAPPKVSPKTTKKPVAHKKSPLCKKDQRSTKKHPCRKR